MKIEQQKIRRDSNLSYLALRQWLGILGLALPVLLWVFNGFEIKPSLSHFYYSSSSVIFTGFMITFGVFLFVYPGRDDASDSISDNWVTNIGGMGAVLTGLIPTAYDIKCHAPFVYDINLMPFCGASELTTPYLHNSTALGVVHFLSAAIFLILMGYMSFSRFTKGNTSPHMKWFYKACAIMVWLPLVAVGMELVFAFEFTVYDVFICECISLFFFGMAWLVKGKAFERFGFY